MNLKLLAFLLITGAAANAQKNLNLGLGYFGETLAHPGIVVKLERESFYGEKVALTNAAEVGFYNHPRNHSAAFSEINFGYRRYFGEGKWYLEQAVGLGAMFSFYNEDVWHVDEQGGVAKVSGFANVDFMPSLQLGAGYNLGTKNQKVHYIWLKPKIFWQMPFNNLALPHLAVQVGYTMNLKTK